MKIKVTKVLFPRKTPVKAEYVEIDLKDCHSIRFEFESGFTLDVDLHRSTRTEAFELSSSTDALLFHADAANILHIEQRRMFEKRVKVLADEEKEECDDDQS